MIKKTLKCVQASHRVQGNTSVVVVTNPEKDKIQVSGQFLPNFSKLYDKLLNNSGKFVDILNQFFYLGWI